MVTIGNLERGDLIVGTVTYFFCPTFYYQTQPRNSRQNCSAQSVKSVALIRMSYIVLRIALLIARRLWPTTSAF